MIAEHTVHIHDLCVCHGLDFATARFGQALDLINCAVCSSKITQFRIIRLVNNGEEKERLFGIYLNKYIMLLFSRNTQSLNFEFTIRDMQFISRIITYR